MDSSAPHHFQGRRERPLTIGASWVIHRRQSKPSLCRVTLGYVLVFGGDEQVESFLRLSRIDEQRWVPSSFSFLLVGLRVMLLRNGKRMERNLLAEICFGSYATSAAWFGLFLMAILGAEQLLSLFATSQVVFQFLSETGVTSAHIALPGKKCIFSLTTTVKNVSSRIMSSCCFHVCFALLGSICYYGIRFKKQ